MSNGHILFAERESTDRSRIFSLLKQTKAGSSIITVHDGCEVLDYVFGTRRQDPALVLLDATVSNPDSFAVLRHIRNTGETKHLPVVMLIPFGRKQALAESYSLGANGCVVKTPNDNDMAHQFEILTSYWTEINQLPAASPSGTGGETANRNGLIILLSLAQQVARELDLRPIQGCVDLALHLTTTRTSQTKGQTKTELIS